MKYKLFIQEDMYNKIKYNAKVIITFLSMGISIEKLPDGTKFNGEIVKPDEAILIETDEETE